jgi:hypothetical protein
MDKLNRWLNLFASLGVVAGLVFLAIELRQNTQVTIGAASEGLTNQSLEFFSMGMDNQVIARAIHKQEAGEELDGFEMSQLRRLQYFNFRVFENAYLQYRRGFFDEGEWDRYRKIIAYRLSNDPFAVQMWEDSESRWTTEFQMEVDEIRDSLRATKP